MATIQRRKAAISEAHKLAGEPNPCLDPLVKQVTKGVRRQLGVAPQHRKAGLSTADVRAIVGGLDPTRVIDVATGRFCCSSSRPPCAGLSS